MQKILAFANVEREIKWCVYVTRVPRISPLRNYLCGSALINTCIKTVALMHGHTHSGCEETCPMRLRIRNYVHNKRNQLASRGCLTNRNSDNHNLQTITFVFDNYQSKKICTSNVQLFKRSSLENIFFPKNKIDSFLNN